VLVAGCLSCTAFLGSYREIEAVHRDYAPKGVKFYYVYRALAHPENNSVIKPFVIKERLMHIEEAQKRLKTKVPWLADNMNNDFKRTAANYIGDSPAWFWTGSMFPKLMINDPYLSVFGMAI
jgi:hypothetical protein